MKIRFKTDFANNWKAGDIVDAKYLDNGDVLVDCVAAIDAGLLFEACEIIEGNKCIVESGELLSEEIVRK